MVLGGRENESLYIRWLPREPLLVSQPAIEAQAQMRASAVMGRSL